MNRSLKEMFPEVTADSEFFWQNLRRPEIHDLVNRARQSVKPVECQLERVAAFIPAFRAGCRVARIFC